MIPNIIRRQEKVKSYIDNLTDGNNSKLKTEAADEEKYEENVSKLVLVDSRMRMGRGSTTASFLVIGQEI